MPSTVTKTVKSAGGDFSSLSSWESTQNANIVTADQIQQAECYIFVDATAVVVAGWTTDATRYVRIYTPAAQQHTGVAGTGYRLNAVSDFNKLLSITTCTFIRLEGLSLSHLSTSANTSSGDTPINFAPGTNTAELRINNCIIPQTPREGVFIHNGVLKAKNTAVWVAPAVAWEISDDSGSDTVSYLYNCLAVSNTSTTGGFEVALNTTVNLKNCYTANTGSGGVYSISGTMNRTTCMHSTAGVFAGSTASTAYSTANFSNVTSGSENLRLPAASALIAAATDLSADANYAFSDDIVNLTRGASWDVGAFAYTSTEQEGFQFVNDDGNEAGSTFYGSQDVNATWPVNSNIRVRVLLNWTLQPAVAGYQLEYRKTGDTPWSIAGITRQPPDATQLSPSSNIPAGGGTATTARLTAPSGKTTANFVAGLISDDTNPLTETPVSAQYTEMEWCVLFPSRAAGSSYDFRVTDGGTALATYTVTPNVTLTGVSPDHAFSGSGFSPNVVTSQGKVLK